MALHDQVREAFAPGGLLSCTEAGFRPREGQTQMAMAVARTVEAGGTLVVEAGTGVGKTFAYLVPALLSGERVLLSTATKTLQDQLFGRDLPRLVQALGLPVRTALLKGRGSYLCLHRMELSRRNATLPDRNAVRALAKVEEWARVTATGDLAELPGLDERSPIIPLVTSTRDNCLGSICPQFRACHVHLARREALAADVVVINHHLFFADLAVRESGMAELLPTVRVAIFDEAHQLNETGVQFLGVQMGTAQLSDFARDMLAAGLQQARGLVDWSLLAAATDRAARDLRLVVGRATSGARLRWVSATPDGVEAASWLQAMSTVHQVMGEVVAGLAMVSEMGPDFVRLHERAQALILRCRRLMQPAEEGVVRWVDVGTQLRLTESPLDIAATVRAKLVGDPQTPDPGGGTQGPARAWIFTSATLGAEPKLKWFTEPCGLEDAEVLQVGSPFDYGRQAAIYVPTTLPKPNDPSHSLQVARLAGDAAQRLGGRTMVLTTTLRALRCIGEELQARFGSDAGIEVLVQGQWPKRRLMERFRQGAKDGGKGCVLIASASFWEGVDVPGEALELVVIDKLPFPPPNDPLVEARAKRLELQGRSPFNDYFVPEAAVALKQGAGRLIRRETDQGVLVVCDSRLATMGYGRRLLAALPPMRALAGPDELVQVLEGLATTRVSTRDCLPT